MLYERIKNTCCLLGLTGRTEIIIYDLNIFFRFFWKFPKIFQEIFFWKSYITSWSWSLCLVVCDMFRYHVGAGYYVSLFVICLGVTLELVIMSCLWYVEVSRWSWSLCLVVCDMFRCHVGAGHYVFCDMFRCHVGAGFAGLLLCLLPLRFNVILFINIFVLRHPLSLG